MSLYDYKNAKIIKRVETVQINTKEDCLHILTNNDLNRVQKVLAIRQELRDSYKGYKSVVVRFVDGVIADLIDCNKLEGRPIPEVIYFDVELEMPLLQHNLTWVARKSGSNLNCDQRFYNDEWNS